MFLIDTNVLSEFRKAMFNRADEKVVAWSGSVGSLEMFISAATIYELELGALGAERRDPAQGAVLRRWLEFGVLKAFAGRIIPIDELVALRAAALNVPNRRPFADGLIAATAWVHGMTVVTRNVTDFEGAGVAVLNPWTA